MIATNLPRPRTAFTLKTIGRDELPAERERAAAAGLSLDAWHPVTGDDETIAVRLFEDADAFDEAQSYRYLGLLLPAADA